MQRSWAEFNFVDSDAIKQLYFLNIHNIRFLTHAVVLARASDSNQQQLCDLGRCSC